MAKQRRSPMRQKSRACRESTCPVNLADLTSTRFFVGKALRNVAMAAARASAVKVELLDSDNAMVRDRASSFILGASGISGNDDGMAKPGMPAPGLTIVVTSERS
jgi:hypothetical protein